MAQYPAYVDGQRLSAVVLRDGQSTLVYKIASTDRSGTTTFDLDPDLWFEVEGGAVYVIEFGLEPAGSTGKVKVSWQVPSGVTPTYRSCMGPGSSATEIDSNNIAMRSGVHGFTTSVPYGKRGTTANLSQSACLETACITTVSAGVVGILWAQNAATDTSRMGAGSWGRLSRIA